MSRRLAALAGSLILVLGLGLLATQSLRAQTETEPATPAAPAPWERWSSLTDQQKEELKKARNAVLDARLELLEKQAELGLLDADLVDAWRERIAWLKEAPVGPEGVYGCPGWGGRGFPGRRPGSRGPGARGWGMMGPGW